jgi:uncharacterized protein YjbJ (UPF0337 family)
MSDKEGKDSWLEAGVKGVVEEVKGRAKKTLGAMTGNDSLEEQGQAQRDKAGAQRDVAAAEVDAAKARGKADAFEDEQRDEQQPRTQSDGDE